MTILDQIINDKKKEVAFRKSVFPASYWESSPLFEREIISISNLIRKSKSGIIAEHKRRSPSKQTINNSLTVNEVAKGYENAGVCGMSVLTDGKYFGGSLEDLTIARASSNIPLLRKDFIIDTYQIIEAKANGADFILLISALLNKMEIFKFSTFAKNLGLEVLLEVHNIEELEKAIMPSLDLLGVNNRNLKTFEVDLDISKSLVDKIPDDFVKVSESGISKVKTIQELKACGYQGFLIGENFMKTNEPGTAAANFIKQLENEI